MELRDRGEALGRDQLELYVLLNLQGDLNKAHYQAIR